MHFDRASVLEIKDLVPPTAYSQLRAWAEYYFFNFFDVNEDNVESVESVYLHKMDVQSMSSDQIFRCLKLLSSKEGLKLIDRLCRRLDVRDRLGLPNPAFDPLVDNNCYILHVSIHEWINIFKSALGVHFMYYVLDEVRISPYYLSAFTYEVRDFITDDFADILMFKDMGSLDDKLKILERHINDFVNSYIPSLKSIDRQLQSARSKLAFAIKLVADKKELSTRPGFQFELF